MSYTNRIVFKVEIFVYIGLLLLRDVSKSPTPIKRGIRVKRVERFNDTDRKKGSQLTPPLYAREGSSQKLFRREISHCIQMTYVPRMRKYARPHTRQSIPGASVTVELSSRRRRKKNIAADKFANGALQ